MKDRYIASVWFYGRPKTYALWDRKLGRWYEGNYLPRPNQDEVQREADRLNKEQEACADAP